MKIGKSAFIHYSWIVLALTFLTLIVAAGVRSMPGILIVPLETYFGWNRAVISGALAISLLLYGLCGPLAAALIERYGTRLVMSLALLSVAIGSGLSTWMSEPWHMTVLWGIVVGVGCGFLSSVLGMIIASRWFVRRRGLVVGIFSAAGSAGQLVFLPLYSRILVMTSWQMVSWFIAASSLLVMVLVGILMRNHPRDLGLLPYGAVHTDFIENTASANSFAVVFSGLKTAVSYKDFWLLSGSFFVCGASSSGLIGTHFIPACADHGISEVTAAGMLSISGVFNVVGATGAGWLSDKFDNRWLLFWFYLLRGATLALLPFELASGSFDLLIFIIFYGLDWSATVPPTVRLTTNIFGKQSGVIFGWIMAIHQLGAALAALCGGVLHTIFGSYQWAFVSGAICCLIAAGMVISIYIDNKTYVQ